MSNDVLIEPLAPLISDELTLPLQPDFSSLVNDSLSGVATPEDGFDAVLTDLVQIVDALEGALITLGGADGGELDDVFLEISALDADAPGVDVANLTTALPDVQTNVNNLGNLLITAALPAPPAGGGAAAVGCGKHGQSRIGQFDFASCDLLLTLPISSVADGPCTTSFPISPAFTLNAPPAIFVSFTLTSGDPVVWTLAGHSGTSGTGERQDYYDIRVTPKAPGHYDATGTLVTAQPAVTAKVCMSVDVIP